MSPIMTVGKVWIGDGSPQPWRGCTGPSPPKSPERPSSTACQSAKVDQNVSVGCSKWEEAEIVQPSSGEWSGRTLSGGRGPLQRSAAGAGGAGLCADDGHTRTVPQADYPDDGRAVAGSPLLHQPVSHMDIYAIGWPLTVQPGPGYGSVGRRGAVAHSCRAASVTAFGEPLRR